MTEADRFEFCAQRLRALADPERLRIIDCLFDGPRNVGELVAELQHDIVKVSHHLGVLRHAHLVACEKRGRFVTYSLHPDVFSAAQANDPYLDLGCCKLEIPAQPPHGRRATPRKSE